MRLCKRERGRKGVTTRFSRRVQQHDARITLDYIMSCCPLPTGVQYVFPSRFPLAFLPFPSLFVFLVFLHKSAPSAKLQRREGMSTSTADIKKITLLTAGTATSTYVILHLLTAFVKPFDSSHTIAGTSEPGLRWDALHFQAVATRGYQYEQQLAFQPGWHGLLYLLRNLGSGLRGTEENVLTGLLRASFLMSLTSRVIANAFLYR